MARGGGGLVESLCLGPPVSKTLRILLDTLTWIWWEANPKRLNARCYEALEDPENLLLLSAASSWEIGIKYALKKLDLPEPPGQYVPKRLTESNINALSVEHAHALRVAELPLQHRDPFDRLLVAQAQVEGVTLATADPSFLLYEVDILWAGADEPPSAVHEGRRPWRTERGRRSAGGKPGLAKKKVGYPRRKAVAGPSRGRKTK